MPAKGRKDPSLLASPDGDVIPLPSPEEQEADAMGGEAMEQNLVEPTMVYDGELAGSSMTLAVVLPGDSKESYFRGFFNGRKQPHESDSDFMSRIVVNTRELALLQLDDGIDAVAEFGKAIASSGRLTQ